MTRYKLDLKLHTLRFLRRHFIENQCCVGANDALSLDDYGMLSSVVSLSPRGQTLNPGKQNEGALFYCYYPGLVEPVFLAENDGDEDYAQFINVYIHLLLPGQRRSTVIEKARQDGLKRNEDPSTPAEKRPRMSASNKNPRGSPFNQQHLQQEIATLTREVSQLRSAAVPLPALPSAPPI
jgi:hypothetical protein